MDEEGSATLARAVSEPEDTRERQGQQVSAQTSRPTTSSAHSTTHQHVQQTSRPLPAAKPAAPAAAVKRGPDQPAPRRQPHEDVTPGLPSGATWGTQRQEAANASQAAPVADDMAWPSLADSTAQVKARVEESNNNHRRSTSVTSSVDRAPSVNSSTDLMSQDPVVLPEQLGLAQSVLHGQAAAGFYQQAQVSTSVFGMSRTVNLQLGGNQGEPYPEAVSLLSNINQAVRAGTLTSKDAAAQLVSLLKQKEAQNGKVQSQLAAGKAPPGFSMPGAPAPIAPPPATSSSGQQGAGLSAQLGGSLLSPLDNPIVPAPPIGRYQPIGKPIGPPGGLQQLQQAGAGQYGGAFGQQQQGTGTYSMWSGLPGIELTTGGYNPLAASWNQGGLGLVQQANPTTSSTSSFTNNAAAKAPPPGFGHLAVGTGATAESRYNPLAARAPPPGMSSYRPQLGAGM